MKWTVVLALWSMAAINGQNLGEISGAVFDASTQKGIAHARVTIYVFLGSSGYDKFNAKPLYVLTDSDGSFRVTGLPDSWVKLWCEKAGYLDFDEQGDGIHEMQVSGAGVRNGEIILHLTSAGAISGSVFDERGAPLWQAEIQVYRQVSGQTEPILTATERTDELGSFRISGLGSGRFAVAVALGFPIVSKTMSPVFFPGTEDRARAEWFELEPGSERRVELRMKISPAK